MKKIAKFLFKKRNQEGFSLIELMIVVVIIGLLSTMAVPQYRNFQMKAKQAEAKTNLGGLYSAMQTFNAEYNWYYGDFRAVGFDLEGALNYNVGASASHALGPASHPAPQYKNKAAVQFNAATRCGNGAATGGKQPACKSLAGAGATWNAITGTSIANPVTGIRQFVVGATANLDNDAAFDRWSINQNKVLTQDADDIAL